MNGNVPHIVQYQGSKRILAPQILRFIPSKFNRLVEPFAGMAAITIAVARQNRADNYLVNDLNAPLVAILKSAIETPIELYSEYAKVWNEQCIFFCIVMDYDFFVGMDFIACFGAFRISVLRIEEKTAYWCWGFSLFVKFYTLLDILYSSIKFRFFQ